jgi:hypothetical protein
MAALTTTTSAGGAYGYPPGSCMDRAVDTGNLWMVMRTTATTVAVYRSTDNGVSWGSQGSFTRTGLYDIGEMRIDNAGDHLHIVMQVNESSLDKLYYKRIDIRSGSASFATGEILLNSAAATTARDYWYSAAIVAYKNPDNTFAIVVGGAFHSPSFSGTFFYGVSIRNDSVLTTYTNDGILSPQRRYHVTGDDTAGITLSMDLEHNGDGITTTTPNIWAAFQIHGIAYCIKFTWQGYKTGWATPSIGVVVASGRLAIRDLPARWDGTRFIIMSTNPTDSTKMDIFERNTSNTSSVKRTSPTHPNPSPGINANMLSYNHITKDFRLFAVGAGVLYYVDYIRATNTWQTWTVANATAPITSEWGLKRGTYGTNQYDVYVQTGTTPWTLSTYILAVNFAPTAPTWITGSAGTPVTNGAAFDVSVSLVLDWVFNDPNATDTQGSFALSRQIGAATIQYWRTSDSTWQAAEVQNTSATSALTLTTGQWLGAGGAADLAHVYKVKTWDAAGSPSVYSAGLSVIPSTRVDPTLTAPTAAQILNTGIVTATWTVTEQSAYRITLTNSATTAIVHDSGFRTDPTPLTPAVLTYAVPVILPDGFAGSLTLQSKNAEGLTSVTRTVAFTVDFVEPVAPLITALAAAPTLGGINVTLTQPAATGTQPATVAMDLYRRVVVSVVPVNANPYFETNTTDWTNQGYTSMVRSVTFAHTGVAALFMTPTGAAATPYVQSGLYPVTAGTRWEQRGWFRSTTANKTVRLKLQWYDNTPTLLSESTRDFTSVAGVWIWMYQAATAPALATQVRWAVGQIGTPAVGDTLYVDEAVLMAANDDTGTRVGVNVVSGTTVLDWRTVTGVDYEWAGYATAGNGTVVAGPWAAS